MQIIGIEPILFLVGSQIHHQLCVICNYAPQTRFELVTYWLTASCSTVELLRIIFEQVIGLEPTLFHIGNVMHHLLCVTCLLWELSELNGSLWFFRPLYNNHLYEVPWCGRGRIRTHTSRRMYSFKD